MLFVTGPISGDGPALALAATAVLLALRYRERQGVGRAVAVGIAMGAALCVKLLVLPAALPVGLVFLSSRRWKHLGAAVAAAVGVFLVTALPWGIGKVWHQSVAYHEGAARTDSYGGNAIRLLRTLVERDPFVVAAFVMSAVVLVWSVRRGRAAVRGDPAVPVRLALLLLGTWAGAQALLLVLEPAMWRPHVSQMIVPLALLATLRPAPLPALVAACVVLAPWWVTNVDTILWPSGYDRVEQAAVDRLERLPERAQVITDEPGLAWRAQRRPPDMLVDASIKRIEQHDLTPVKVARAARRRRVCAVLVWSAKRFGSLAGLPERLEAEVYHVAARYGGPKVLYQRGQCTG
jgi:hypothetical protein